MRVACEQRIARACSAWKWSAPTFRPQPPLSGQSLVERYVHVSAVSANRLHYSARHSYAGNGRLRKDSKLSLGPRFPFGFKEPVNVLLRDSRPPLGMRAEEALESVAASFSPSVRKVALSQASPRRT